MERNINAFCFVLFFETGFLCVTVLTVLELALVDQAGLHLTASVSARIKDVCHNCLAKIFIFTFKIYLLCIQCSGMYVYTPDEGAKINYRWS